MNNNPIGSPIINTGGYANIYTPNFGGNFYINLSIKCGNQICKVCKFYFSTTCPPKTDCCNDSKFGSFKIGSLKLTCTGKPQHVGTFSCNEVVPIQSSFYCNDSTCAGQVKYLMVDGNTGASIGNPIITAAQNTTNITMPNQSGYYCIKVFGICGENICAVIKQWGSFVFL